MSYAVRFATTVVIATTLTSAQISVAAVVGQWQESDRTWNSGEFTTIRTTVTSGGHAVEADSALTAANLANDDAYLIGEPSRNLNPTEQADLSSWINAGGILMLFVDSGTSDFPQANDILSGLGTTLSFNTSQSVTAGPIQDVNYAADNIFDLVGSTPTFSPGHATVLGGAGAHLSETLIAVQPLGNGYVFAFGDRFEHNFSNSTAASTNGQLMLNILGPIPEPTSLALVAISLVIVGQRRVRRS